MSIKNTLLLGSGLSRSTTKEEIKSRLKILSPPISFDKYELRV
jgi:hypothetical protein